MKLRRQFKLIATAAVTVLVGMGALTQSASAATIVTSGTIGPVGLPTGDCTYYPTWNRLDVKVPSPTIYAPNVRAGAGNDSAWTRYQVQIVNQYNQVIWTSNFSGWAASYDNIPAAFSGAPLTVTSIPEYSKVRIGVEWSYGGSNSGAAIYSLDRYNLYTAGLSLPAVNPDSCSKWVDPRYRG